MGKARVGALWVASLAVVAVPAGPRHALAQSRFLSYTTESECAGGHILSASVCRSAFANARAEFEAKTPAFSSMAQCAKAFGACSPWPPGRHGRGAFRPQWSGIDIVDTPREKSVTPARVSAGKKLSFVPRPLMAPAGEPRELVVRASRPMAGGRFGPPPIGNMRIQHAFHAPRPEPVPGPSAQPPSGSGFKLEDGVLTYPAPARFAPKNLPKLP